MGFWLRWGIRRRAGALWQWVLTVQLVLPADARFGGGIAGWNWCMGFWQCAQIPGCLAARCGSRRSKQGFTQMQADGRKTREWGRGCCTGGAHQGLSGGFLP
jgi:hypothetical protein